MFPEKGNQPATVILIEKCITIVETSKSKLSWYYYYLIVKVDRPFPLRIILYINTITVLYNLIQN